MSHMIGAGKIRHHQPGAARRGLPEKLQDPSEHLPVVGRDEFLRMVGGLNPTPFFEGSHPVQDRRRKMLSFSVDPERLAGKPFGVCSSVIFAQMDVQKSTAQDSMPVRIAAGGEGGVGGEGGGGEWRDQAHGADPLPLQPLKGTSLDPIGIVVTDTVKGWTE